MLQPPQDLIVQPVFLCLACTRTRHIHTHGTRVMIRVSRYDLHSNVLADEITQPTLIDWFSLSFFAFPPFALPRVASPSLSLFLSLRSSAIPSFRRGVRSFGQFRPLRLTDPSRFAIRISIPRCRIAITGSSLSLTEVSDSSEGNVCLFPGVKLNIS